MVVSRIGGETGVAVVIEKIVEMPREEITTKFCREISVIMLKEELSAERMAT